MRLKYCIPLLALTIPLLAGCIADKQAIKFTDDYPPAATGDQRAAPKEPGLTKSELANIELTVFGYLLARHFGQDGDYSAVFIASDESRTDVLRKKFPQHNPPLKPWWHLNQPPGQAPVDLDTGRPALVLTVEAADPENGVVTAIGKWFAGDAVAGFYTFELRLEHEVWTIQSVK